ncbi:MAG: DUF5683 domain-containing protein, partial [Rubricoccaceae bacterium]|nr:DUF5683 domain-containing protein [Rubricoccaceae bacterium]
MRCIWIIAFVVLASSFLTPASSQVVTDSTQQNTTANPVEPSFPSPRGALIRSLIIPGWGQVYAGQPIKTPFVVGALGGLVGLSIY